MTYASQKQITLIVRFILGKSSDIAPGKHVTFSSDGALSNRKPNQAKPSANKKDLHVKMTARSRKDGLTGW